MLRQVARNAALGMIGQGIGLSLQLVAMILVARNLGVEGFGLYSSALAFAMLFSTLADAGVTNGLARELAVADADRGRSLFGAGLLIKAGGGLLVYGGSLGAALLFGYSGAGLTLIAVMLAAYLASLLVQTVFGVARAFGRMEIESALTVGQSAIFLAWVLLATPTPVSYAWGWFCAYLTSALIGMAVVTRWLIRPRLFLTAGLVRQIWAVGLPLMVSAVLLLLYARLPIYLLTVFSTPREVGLFNAANGLLRNLQMLAFTLSAAAGPALARLSVDDPAALRGAYTLTLRTAFLLVAPIVAGVTVLDTVLVTTLFGPSFSAAAPIMALSAWSLAGFTLSYMGQALLTAQVRAGRWMLALALGAGASLLIGVPLTLAFGALGAMTATLVADLLILTSILAWTAVNLDRAQWRATILSGGLAAGSMALLLWFVRVWPIWLTIPLGAALYVVFILLFRAVRPREVGALLAAAPLPPRVRRWMDGRLKHSA